MLIDQVRLTPLAVIPLEAGNVMHAMQRSSDGFAGFGEAYFSWIAPGVTKGWKRHRTMTLNFVVPVARSPLPSSTRTPASGAATSSVRRPMPGSTVPPGLWMAFRGRAALQSLVLNIADIEHDPAEADSMPEASFAFDWSASTWPSHCDQRIGP